MIKNYTDKDYADKAVEANSKGLSLYILVTPTEFTGEDEQGQPFTYTEDVATLVLAETGYYITYNGNYTDGTINENLEQEKINKRKETFNKEFFKTSLGYIRRKVSMATGDTKDFICDIVPALKTGLEIGKASPIITYNEPDFTQEITLEYMESLQEVKQITAEFLQECTLQLSTDFLPIPLVVNNVEENLEL